MKSAHRPSSPCQARNIADAVLQAADQIDQITGTGPHKAIDDSNNPMAVELDP